MVKKNVERVENKRQIEAFNFYCSLGEGGTCEKVAEKFKVSLTTAKNWSSWFKWQGRIDDINAETSAKVTEMIIEQEVKDQLSYLDTTNKLVDKLRLMLETATTKVESVKDIDILVGSIERLMRLGLDIQGFKGEADNLQPEGVNYLPRVLIPIPQNEIVGVEDEQKEAETKSNSSTIT